MNVRIHIVDHFAVVNRYDAAIASTLQAQTFENACLGCPDIIGVVVVPTARQSLAERFAEVRQPMPHARFFTFSTANSRLDRVERLRLEMMFGEEIAVNSSPSSPPIVRFHSIDPAETLGLSDSETWERAAIWANGPRNHAVATAAFTSVAGRCDSYASRRHDTAAVVEGAIEFQPVVLVVQNAEHADRLSPHLAGWPIVDRSVAWQSNSLVALAHQAFLRRCGLITTQSALEIVTHRIADTVIRADAGVGLIAFSKTALPRLIIDLADVHGARFEHRIQCRRAAYEAAGWLIEQETDAATTASASEPTL